MRRTEAEKNRKSTLLPLSLLIIRQQCKRVEMSEKKGFGPQPPSAPHGIGAPAPGGYMHRAPPPPYDQGQVGVGAGGYFPPPPSYQASIAGQQQPGIPVAQPGYGYPASGMYPATGSAFYPTNTPIHQAMPPGTNYPNTVVFDAGARFSGKMGGSISVPPPPPGYAPNVAQAAALQGQPVLLKKKRNSFF